MEERRGNGIFLGVVSIATLIVAIIGATFAYFSASTQSEDNAVSLQAYEFKLDLDMETVYPTNPSTASGLIPLLASNPISTEQTIMDQYAPNNTNILYAINVAKDRCVDDNGLQVCALYRVKIKNQGSNAMTLSGILETTANNAGTGDEATPFENLTYQGLTGNIDAFVLDKSAQQVKTVVGESIPISDIYVTGATINPETGFVDKEGYGEGYVLIYLNDNKGNQSSEMGATYEGKVVYSSGTGGNTLTGTFKVGGSEAEEPSGDESGEPSGTETTD